MKMIISTAGKHVQPAGKSLPETNGNKKGVLDVFGQAVDICAFRLAERDSSTTDRESSSKLLEDEATKSLRIAQ